jgi:hypothetical protein
MFDRNIYSSSEINVDKRDFVGDQEHVQGDFRLQRFWWLL